MHMTYIFFIGCLNLWKDYDIMSLLVSENPRLIVYFSQTHRRTQSIYDLGFCHRKKHPYPSPFLDKTIIISLNPES